ncbi:MAG: InlB B-repeat-containing protein [Acholeplasmatales bacterium]|nr:InlB B-repeat-containing protein [Acholeplasmatales bacterium]
MQNKKTEEQDDKEKKRRKLLVFWLPLFSILLLAGVLGLVLGITLKPAKNYVSVHVTYENGNVVGIKDKYTLNEEVTFTAVPNQGYYFAGWIIDGTLDKTNPIKFYANDNEISALFIISTEFGVFLHVDGYTTLWGSTGYPVTNIVLKDVVKEYYTFSGWYIGDDTHSEYATLFEIGYDIAGELHLWAKLDANTHDLYIDLNGDGLYTGPGETLLNHHDEEIVSLPPSVASLNPGEYFINWAIELNGAGPATFSNPSNVIGDALIYPVFSTESYNITFNENGGATVTDGIFAYGATLPTDTKTGYTFNGWFVEGSEGVLYNGTVPDLGNNNQSVTLNASWTIESYNITFDLDGGTGVTDGSYTYNTLLPAPTKAGYTFLGYSSVDNSSVEFEDPSNVIDFGANGASVTLYAIYEASDSTAYTVNHYFENAAGTSYVLDSTKTQSLTGETDTQATASALTVSGFTYNSSHESEVKQGNIAGDGSLVLSLYYSRNTYSITFNSEGGSAVSAIEDVRHGASVNAPAEPTKTGYDFIGWYETSPSLLYTFTTMPIGGVALHASWDAHTYTVVYNSNKPASATGTVTGTTSSSVHTYDVSKNLTANGYALVGYTFTGWATTAAGAKAYNEAQAVTNLAADGTYNLYAVWEANTYTVTYDNNGGTGEIASATATYDSDFTLSNGSSFSKTGYTLTGWATSAEGAKVYNLEEAFEPYLLTAGLDLYAVWTVWQVTITYQGNSGLYEEASSYKPLFP